MIARPRSVILLALLVASAVAASCAVPPPPRDPDLPAVREESDDQGDPRAFTAGRPPAAPVSDKAFSEHLVRSLSALLEAGKTADVADLRKQLGRTRVALELPEGGEREFTPAELYAKSGDSVLVFFSIFQCDRCNRWHANAASGWALTADGVVVTNHHVVETLTKKKPSAVGVATRDGRVFPVTEVLAASKADDVALVRVADGEFTPLALSAGDPAGTPVVVISHPQDRFYTLTTGVISRYFRHAHGPHRHGPKKDEPAGDEPVGGIGTEVESVSITAEYAVGSSGAPVLNPRGAVTAMVSKTKTLKHPLAKQVQMVVRTCVPAASILALIGE